MNSRRENCFREGESMPQSRNFPFLVKAYDMSRLHDVCECGFRAMHGASTRHASQREAVHLRLRMKPCQNPASNKQALQFVSAWL
jgi:hypothetical protein